MSKLCMMFSTVSCCSMACQHLTASSHISKCSKISSMYLTVPSVRNQHASSRLSSYLVGRRSAFSQCRHRGRAVSVVGIWLTRAWSWRVACSMVHVQCASYLSEFLQRVVGVHIGRAPTWCQTSLVIMILEALLLRLRGWEAPLLSLGGSPAEPGRLCC